MEIVLRAFTHYFLVYARNYFLFYGGIFVLFHLLLPRLQGWRKVKQDRAYWKLALLSVKDSLLFHLPFFGILALMKLAGIRPWRFYFDVESKGWPYLIFTVLVLFLYNDLYFYLSHRFIFHRGFMYRRVHSLHHQYTEITPFAGNAVAWGEPILNFIFNLPPLLILPIHPFALFTKDGMLRVVNAVNHIGYEIYPASFSKSPLFKWVTTPSHHYLHHGRDGNTNFSFFINYDSIFGTLNAGYKAAFESLRGASQVSGRDLKR